MKNIINPKHSVFLYILIFGLAFLFLFLPTLWGGATMTQPLYMAIIELPIMIFGGGLEEIGWRGFLQPEVEKKFPSFVSTIIVGVIWAVWHLPLWFIIGTNQYSINFLWFLISTIAMSFVLTQVYSTTKSIFLCMVFHAAINSFWDVFTPNTQVRSGCFMLVFAVIIFLIFEWVRKKAGKKIAQCQ